MALKLFLKLSLALLVIAFSGLFVLKNPDGQPWLNVNDLKSMIPDFSSLTNQVKTLTPDIKNPLNKDDSEKTVAYKWQDENGWHYSSQPPSNIPEDQVTTIIVDPDTNLIPAIPTSTHTKKSAHKLTEKKSKTSSETETSGGINQMLEEANNVQNLMNERTQTLEDQL